MQARSTLRTVSKVSEGDELDGDGSSSPDLFKRAIGSSTTSEASAMGEY